MLQTPDLAFLSMETNPLQAYVRKALLRTELAALYLDYFALLYGTAIVIYARTLKDRLYYRKARKLVLFTALSKRAIIISL